MYAFPYPIQTFVVSGNHYIPFAPTYSYAYSKRQYNVSEEKFGIKIKLKIVDQAIISHAQQRRRVSFVAIFKQLNDYIIFSMQQDTQSVKIITIVARTIESNALIIFYKLNKH